MIRILLINPPPLFSDGSNNPVQSYYPPLGLLYIAAVLEKAGYRVSVCDASINNMSFNLIRNELRKGYDIIGIAAFTGTRESAYLCASLAKEENKGATVALGGPHTTFLAEPTLRWLPFVDVVVRGEGELTFLELAQRISTIKSYEDIEGISFRNESGVPCSNPSREVIENLDSLSFPARHLVPMDKYFKATLRHERHLRRPATTIVTSRGCPGNCIFCSSPTMWGRRTRRRTPENVIGEIKYLHREYGVNDIFFMDDTFTINKRWVVKFCDELMRSKLGISWRCLGRVDTVDRNLLAAMKKAGCYHINYGIESGSPKTLKAIHKGITAEQAIEGLRLTREAGLFVGADYIIGFPGETEEDMKQTLLFMKRNPVHNFVLNIPWLLPGTALYQQAFNEGKINEMTWFESFQPMKGSGVQPSFPIYVSNAFSSREELLHKARKYANWVMSWGYLRRNLKYKWHTLPLLCLIC